MAEKDIEIKELEGETLKKDFWVDPQKAAKVSEELSELKEERLLWNDFSQALAYLKEVAVLAAKDPALGKDFADEVKKLSAKIDGVEFRLFLSGPFDKASAYITVTSGAGGTDAQDWAAMLLRMYSRYAERKGFTTHLLEEHKGEEAGIKKATLEVDGKYVYGYLRGEQGVHRLVRISPYSAQKLRHTSFVLVEIVPQIPEVNATIEIPSEDLEVEAYRSSGPGGQNVNKVSTAVRMKHIPSGITVAVQSARTQGENRAKALELIKTKLYLKKTEERAKVLKTLKGEVKEAEWGSQIRSYVLHPYKMVKDLRSGFETSGVSSVLDGELDDMIESEIRTREIARKTK